MAYIPFEEVKKVTTIERVASWLGLSGTRMQCPVNQGDKRELWINPKTQSFCCFGCKKAGKSPADYSGDLIQLAAHIKGTPVKKEALEIMEHFHGYKPDKRGYPDEGLRALEGVQYEHPRLPEGLTPDRAQALGICYRNKGTSRDVVLVELRDERGRPIGCLQILKDGTLKLPKNLTA